MGARLTFEDIAAFEQQLVAAGRATGDVKELLRRT